MNFIYTIDPEADEPEMVIDSHIGPDEVLEDGRVIKGIDGSVWARELLALDSMGKRRVKVYINSPGGSVSEGYSICSAMLHTKCKVDTYCWGMAASMGAVAFMCGRNRFMADYGILMFHDPFGGDNQELLLKMKNSLITLISSRCGLTPETIAAIMARTTWLDSSEAENIPGIITDIIYSTDNNIGRLAPVKNDAKEYWKTAKLIFNTALKITDAAAPKDQEIKTETKNSINMTEIKKINARLNLMEEASIDSTTKAIDALMNKASDADKKMEEMQAAFEKKEAELKKAKADMEDEAKKNKEAFDKMEGEFIKMKEEKAAFEKKAAEDATAKAKVEAKDLVTAAVKAGKIRNDADTIEKWTVKAEADIAGMKDLLETMGVNLTAPKIKAEGGEAGTGRPENRPYKDAEEASKGQKDLIAEKMKAVQASIKKDRQVI